MCFEDEWRYRSDYEKDVADIYIIGNVMVDA